MVQCHYDLITFSGYSAEQRGREEEEEEEGRTVRIWKENLLVFRISVRCFSSFRDISDLIQDVNKSLIAFEFNV